MQQCLLLATRIRSSHSGRGQIHTTGMYDNFKQFQEFHIQLKPPLQQHSAELHNVMVPQHGSKLTITTIT